MPKNNNTKDMDKKNASRSEFADESNSSANSSANSKNKNDCK